MGCHVTPGTVLIIERIRLKGGAPALVTAVYRRPMPRWTTGGSRREIENIDRGAGQCKHFILGLTDF